jgi:hypothetical protein
MTGPPSPRDWFFPRLPSDGDGILSSEQPAPDGAVRTGSTGQLRLMGRVVPEAESKPDRRALDDAAHEQLLRHQERQRARSSSGGGGGGSASGKGRGRGWLRAGRGVGDGEGEQEEWHDAGE